MAMGFVRRGFLGAAAILCAASSGCGAVPEANPAVSAPTPVVRTEPEPSTALARWLELQEVHGDAVGRRVLYTWTSAEQVAEAVRTGTFLLLKDGTPERRSQFAEDLTARQIGAAPVLVLPPFERRRFAWPSPWPTARGFAGEHYGDRLVRVVLKKEALIWIFTPVTNAFVDVEGKVVSESEALQHASRIAAVYHVGHSDPAKPETMFREYVLVNESQIEEWSAGTSAIAERLLLDAAMLRIASRHLGAFKVRDPATWARDVLEGGWRTGSPTDDVPKRYGASLAFLSDGYRPSPATFESIATRLDAVRSQGEPIVVKPKAVFPADGFVAKGVGNAVPCIPRGSMCVPVKP